MGFVAGRWAALAAALVVGLLYAPVALADWRDEIKVLRVGVMTGPNSAYRLAQLEPFRAYLAETLAVPVEIIPARDYRALIDAQVGSGVHYAIYSAAAFSAAAATCHCVEPIAVPTRPGGETGFYALLVARSDSAIRSLADAKGARLALAGADSVAGRLLPMKAFEAEGIVPADHFSAVVDKGDPQSAIGALLAGEADLAAAWSSMTGDQSTGYSFGVLADLTAGGRLSMDQIRVVWQSPLIPFGPHSIRSDLPDDLKSLLSDTLLAMEEENPAALDAVDRFGGSGLAAVDAGAYAPIDALFAPAHAD